MDELLKQWLKQRLAFLNEAITLRELRGWPNNPVHNAAIIYEMYGWPFDRFDAALIRAESLRARTSGDSHDQPNQTD